jgi:hypothetical protein
VPEADRTVNAVRGIDARKSGLHLVVGFAFDEASRMATHVPSTDFIVDPDQQCEGHGRQPPVDPGQKQ